MSRSIPLDRWQSQLVSGQCDLFLFFCSGEKRKAFREFSETIRTSIPLFFVTLTVGKRNYCTLEVVNPATTHNVCCKYICWMGTIVGSFDCYFEKSSSFFFFFISRAMAKPPYWDWKSHLPMKNSMYTTFVIFDE